MPEQRVEGLFGRHEAIESTVIGDLEQGKLAGKFHWIAKPGGTIDGLRIFGSDGKLYPAAISGVYSVQRKGTGFKACWPQRKGRVVVWLQNTTNAYDWTLHTATICAATPTTYTFAYA